MALTGDAPRPTRSAQAQVRNPLLALEATQRLLELPEAQRLALAAMLAELSTEAHAKAETSWRQRKGPMAAYWRAVGVYARHTSRALRKGPAAATPAEAWAERCATIERIWNDEMPEPLEVVA